jgi:ferredoxin
MESQPNWNNLSEAIADAAAACPVNVIKYEIQK